MVPTSAISASSGSWVRQQLSSAGNASTPANVDTLVTPSTTVTVSQLGRARSQAAAFLASHLNAIARAPLNAQNWLKAHGPAVFQDMDQGAWDKAMFAIHTTLLVERLRAHRDHLAPGGGAGLTGVAVVWSASNAYNIYAKPKVAPAPTSAHQPA